MQTAPGASRGSLILLVMCLLAVLGIALASYLAIANNSMKLSNRTYAKDVSFHLAEMGLERGLRSFNASTFSSWTHPDATTSTRTFSITTTHYSSSGITVAVNVRVDRYTASTWSAATAYAVNDMVWYRGVWFHCRAANTNQAPPNASYWVSAPAAWNSDANYNSTGTDIVLFGGSAYRCTAANSNQVPPNASYWTSASVSTWNSGTSYAVNDVALKGGTAYRCISANSNQTPPSLTYWISVPVIYSQGVATLPDNASTTMKTELKAEIAPAPLFPNAVGATSTVYLASGGTVDSYNSILDSGYGSPGSSAVLAGGDSSSTAVTITSARLNGYVAAAPSSSIPNSPQFSYGGSAIVTNVAPPATPSPKIDPSRVSRSPFVPQFDIQSVSGTVTDLPSPALGPTYLPNASITLGTPGLTTPTIYDVTYTYTPYGWYSGMLLYGSTNIVTIASPVILNVSGSYFGIIYGNLVISPGASLEIYFSSSARMYFGYFSSGTGIDNQTKDPTKLLIASTQANNTLNYNYFQYTASALPFYGTLYMPNAYVTVGSNAAIYGAISAKNIRFTSNATLHYDTSLRTAGSVGTYIDKAYLITQWRELTDPSEQVTLP